MRNTKTAINTRHARKFNTYNLSKFAIWLRPNTTPLTRIASSKEIIALFPRLPISELFVECFYEILHATPRITDFCRPICVRVETEKCGYKETPLYYNFHTREIIDTEEYNQLIDIERAFWRSIFGSSDNIELHFSPFGISSYLQKAGVKYEVVEKWTGCTAGRSAIPTYKDMIVVSLEEMKKRLDKQKSK